MNINTPRLEIVDLTLQHSDFILKLLNTPDWLKNIGDKKVYNLDQAEAFILNLIQDPFRNYWPVLLKENNTPIGVIALIQRDYLQYPDFGFSLLPDYYKKGYALEAAKAVLENLFNQDIHQIHGITLMENQSSIQLLKKLGFELEKEFQKDNESLYLFTLKR
ncbi:MAG: GNAT family N-acetyltransferase [Saprospiraceae bacterium]